jgi:4-diphosphocytidyl-2-C-methyl-D-erythritol kinase
VISFPNGKINIGLTIIRKRADGYHDLETIFYPIAIRDVLEISPADQLQLHLSGNPIGNDHRQNLCEKAYQLVKADFPNLPPVAIHLHKGIPVGAGLGGGSADSVFLIQLLNSGYELNLSAPAILKYASKLGSDCPFFVLNKPCFATGRGEILEPISLDLDGFALVFIHPGIKISTAEAFSMIRTTDSPPLLKTLIAQPIHQWRNKIVNDFEEPLMSAYPSLHGIKAKLYEAGALYASMTGSGSSFYGIFEKDALPKKEFFYDHRTPMDVEFISSSSVFQ